MGTVLAAPVTTKESGNGSLQAKGLVWGHSCMQGWRVQMEDAHFALPSLDGEGWADTAAFGVMDGHGGKEVARFCERFLPGEISKGSSSDMRSSLVSAFHRMDEMLLDEDQSSEILRSFSGGTGHVNPDWVGCTCVVCLVRPDVLIVANAGDSRAVLSRSRQAVPLSEDHKPNLPTEHERIRQAGGQVDRRQVGPMVQYRVNGNLNLSRSIGDLEYKKNTRLQPCEQMICSTPDVSTFKREVGDEFLIVACDGIWDVLGNQDAVDFVHERLQACLRNGRPLSSIMEEMLDHCLSPDLNMTNGLGGDNMTAMLVVFDTPSLSGGTAMPNSSMLFSEGSVPVSSTATVEDGAILPTGLCGCKPDTTK